MQLVLLDIDAKHLTLIGKTAERNIANFMATMRRNSPSLTDWTFSTATAKFAYLSAATALSAIPDGEHGIAIITYIYFIVHECFIVPFSEIYIQNFKL